TGGTLDYLVVNGSGKTWRVGPQNLSVAQTLTLTAGTLDLSNQSVDLSTGGLTVNGGTLEAVTGNVTAGGSFAMTSGTVNCPGSSKTFSIGGDYAQTGGTFTPSTGTVTLAASSSNHTLDAVGAFNSLNLSSAANWTVTNHGFTAANFQCSSGALDLGASLTSTVTTTFTVSA